MKNKAHTEWPILILCGVLAISFLLVPTKDLAQRLFSSILFVFLIFPIARKVVKMLYRAYLLNLENQL